MHQIIRVITGAIIPGCIVGALMFLLFQAGTVTDQIENRSMTRQHTPSYEACKIGPDPRNCTWDGVDNGTVGTLNYWISPNEWVWPIPHHIAHFIVGWEFPPRTEYMPCGREDDRNCVWDARHRGNGMGDSFFIGKGGRQWLLPHHIAHYLLGLPKQPA